jgi:opacity protein-like surface antigen
MLRIACSTSTSAQRRLIPAIALVLAASVPVLAQNPPPPRTSTADDYSTVDVNLFAGYQHFLVDNRDAARVNSFSGGAIGGFRLTEDFSKYVGLEESFSFAGNNLAVIPFGGTIAANANSHNFTVAVNPMFYFTPRDSKIRPFVTAGPGYTWYDPTPTLDTSVTPIAIPPADPLQHRRGVALIYGAGVKYNMTRNVGLRFDFRALMTQGWEFGLPETPAGTGTFYIPNHSTENALSLTGGVFFRFGHHSDEVLPPPHPAPKPVAHVRVGGVS